MIANIQDVDTESPQSAMSPLNRIAEDLHHATEEEGGFKLWLCLTTS